MNIHSSLPSSSSKADSPDAKAPTTSLSTRSRPSAPWGKCLSRRTGGRWLLPLDGHEGAGVKILRLPGLFYGFGFDGVLILEEVNDSLSQSFGRGQLKQVLRGSEIGFLKDVLFGFGFAAGSPGAEAVQ